MKHLLLLCTFFYWTAAAQQNPHYEFRAVWIATVSNIDWPGRKDLSTDQQKAEFIRILDMHQRHGMNAVIVQVRPSADAFYPSPYEPWSEFLTGKQGVPPSPYYDPLQFMLDETHKRGMEFHAWFNPYRAVFGSNSSVAANHVTKKYPHWFVNYAGKKYFNPGLPEVRQHVNAIIKDVVNRYDIDAIHFDDYFYPYPVAGKDFPDATAFRQYGAGMTKEEWRRSNVDSIIAMLSTTIKSTNSSVKFGISPFGVWRNAAKDPMGSVTRAGLTNYDDLYADILLWLQNGWIDYVAPQLYWEIGHKLCDYNVLLDWWSKNGFGRHVYIGHGIYRTSDKPTASWRNPKELPAQITNLRQYETVQGSAYFSSKSFNRNPNGWSDSLRNNYYKHPALVPPMYWIDSVPPPKPEVGKIADSRKYMVDYTGKEPIKGFVLYSVEQGKQATFSNAVIVNIFSAQKLLELDLSTLNIANNVQLFVSAIDKSNNVSDWVELR
jgi:uncharacterized lipoprotein YddW (UPF0748 family)